MLTLVSGIGPFGLVGGLGASWFIPFTSCRMRTLGSATDTASDVECLELDESSGEGWMSEPSSSSLCMSSHCLSCDMSIPTSLVSW